MARMIGRNCATGPGGIKCSCCNFPPGKRRVERKRSVKRSERHEWRQSVAYERRRFDLI